ncbi:MAG: alpha/beta hydrolase [Proteobacteria bacterium]|nr:alpha/beta hydrolase [Pseudomonadota bacterium]
MMKTKHVLIAVSLLSLLWISGCANGLFYHPNQNDYSNPSDSGLVYEDVTFASKDGTQLHGWFIPARGQAWATVIHFHGNAANISAHLRFVSWLPYKGCNVLMFDYRGYGASQGRPFRQGVFEDSMAALDYTLSRNDVDKDRIVFLGQSLGGANAIAVAAVAGDAAVRALVVDSSFYSYRTIVRDKIGDIPVIGWFKWPLSYVMATDSFHSGNLIEAISPIPVLIIHGIDDEVVPYHHGQMLYERAKEPKTFLTVDRGRHISALTAQGSIYQMKMLDFYRQSLDFK